MVSSLQTNSELNLYNYQAEDVERMKYMPHVLLFSDMGTGKTVVSASHIKELELLPCLILCPTTLKLNWFDEIEKWIGVEPYYAESTDDIVDYYYSCIEKGVDAIKQMKRIFILHHEALAYVEGDPIREMITEMKWKSVIIDESHRFRNMGALRTETLMNFSGNGAKFLFLTGTPIVNSNFDMYPMLEMVELVNNPDEFLSKYTYGYNGPYGYKISGSRNKEELLQLMAPMYIRRTKEEVLEHLPPIRILPVRLEMTPDQRESYSHFEEMMCLFLDDEEEITSPNILSLLTRLRQLSLDPTIIGKKSNSSKTKAIKELIESNPSEKWIIMTTSKAYVKYLAKKLPGIVTMTGETPPAERQLRINEFEKNPTKNVLALTYKVGGLGINLQFAHYMILADQWWHSETTEQAIGRIQRPGQKHPMTVYRLHNTNSIDDLMQEKILKKKAMADEIVLDEDEMAQYRMTDSDLVKAIYQKRRGFAYAKGQSGEESEGSDD